MRIIAAALTLFFAAPAAWAACPGAQEPAIVATGGALRVCSPESAASIEVERDGTIIPVPGPFAAGVTVPLAGVAACADVTLRARAVNAAGAGVWSGNIAATFPPCGVPVLLGTVPGT